MINVVYPFIKSKWDEIRYSLRSLEEHFEGEIKPFLISDYIPGWAHNINHIKSERHANPYLDTAAKLELCANELEDFIWMNDDTFFLKPTTLADIRTPKALSAFPSFNMPTPWSSRVQEATVQLSKAFPQRTLYNYGTHAPYYYESKKLKELARMFPIFTGFASIELLYFNSFIDGEPEYPDEVLYMTTTQTYKVKSTHRYINCNDNGLTDNLKNYLQRRYAKLSKYEIPGEEDTTEVIEPTYEGINTIPVIYKGKKKNYKFGEFDFSSGRANVPEFYAKFILSAYPQSFMRG